MVRARIRRSWLSGWLFLYVVGLLLASLAVAPTVQAAGITAGTYTELVNAINTANTNGQADTISLTADITLTGLLPDVTSDITFQGNNHTLDGDNFYRILKISGSITVNFFNLKLIHGFDGDPTVSAGGAIANDIATLNMTNLVFDSNQAANDSSTAGPSFGGAFFNNEGIVTINDSTFVNNAAYASFVGSGDTARGGAIFNNSGFLTINNSTFSGNLVQANGGFSGGIAQGGAIYSDLGSLNITNSTFSENAVNADGPDNGGYSTGGAINQNFGSSIITSSTFANNHLSANGTTFGLTGGENYAYQGGAPQVKNTIFKGLTGPGSSTNCLLPVNDLGGNIQYPDNLCGLTIPIADPLLDPAGVQNNGGPTPTLALLTGSPAINQIAPANCPATDQRGYGRVGLCDTGAFEFGAGPAKNNPQSPPADLVGQLRETPDRVASNDAQNLIRYTFTVKNVGQGKASAVSLTLPIDPGLVIGYTEFDNAAVWVSSLAADAVVVSLPTLSNGEVVSGTIVFRPSLTPQPAPGTEVNSRYTLKWTNPDGGDKTSWSNAVSFEFGGSNTDVSGGEIQLMSADAPNGSVIVYHSDFWIPDEPVTAWITSPDNTSKELIQGNADADGHFAVPVDAAGHAAGTYVIAAYGQSSGTYGSGILVVTVSGDSRAKSAASLNLKALGAKALMVAPTRR